jgi:hypothetical protein
MFMGYFGAKAFMVVKHFTTIKAQKKALQLRVLMG